MEYISRDEAYPFLHSIAETASIIGFEEMGSKARKLMNGLQEKEEKEWSLDEVKHVFELMIIRAIITDILTKLPCERKVKYEIQTFKCFLYRVGWHKDTSPCLVIVDGMMPKMDGLEVLQWLRNRKESVRYKVIYVNIAQKRKRYRAGT